MAHCLAADAGAQILGIGRSAYSETHFTHRVTCSGASVPAPVPQRLRESNGGGRYRYVSLDMRDGIALRRCLEEFRPDVVVHLAGSLRDEPLASLVEHNVLAVAQLFEAVSAASCPPARIVLGSSAMVYGTPRKLPVPETAQCRPNEFYGISKHAGEAVARVLGTRHGVPFIAARIFQVAGPGQDERHLCGRLASQIAAIQGGTQGPRIDLGTMTTTRDFIDVRDVAAALYVLMDRGALGRIYNVASGTETSVQHIYDILTDVAGLRGVVELQRNPPRENDIPRMVADVRRLAALGVTPHFDLRTTLRDVLQYYTAEVYTAHVRFYARPTP